VGVEVYDWGFSAQLFFVSEGGDWGHIRLSLSWLVLFFPRQKPPLVMSLFQNIVHNIIKTLFTGGVFGTCANIVIFFIFTIFYWK